MPAVRSSPRWESFSVKAKKKNDETVRKLDEFIDSILGGDDDNDD